MKPKYKMKLIAYNIEQYTEQFKKLIINFLIDAFEISPNADVKVQMQNLEVKEDCEVITVELTIEKTSWTYKLLWDTTTNNIIDYCLISD